MVESGQAIQACGAVGVPDPQHLLEERQRLLEEREGRLVVTHLREEHGQVAQALRVVGVPAPQHFLAQRQRLLEERDGRLVVPPRMVECGKVAQARGIVGVPDAQRLLVERRRLLVDLEGRLVIPQGLKERSQVAQAGGVGGVLLAHHLLAQRRRLLREWEGLGRLALPMQCPRLGSQGRRLPQCRALGLRVPILRKGIRQLQPGSHDLPVALAVKRRQHAEHAAAVPRLLQPPAAGLFPEGQPGGIGVDEQRGRPVDALRQRQRSRHRLQSRPLLARLPRRLRLIPQRRPL